MIVIEPGGKRVLLGVTGTEDQWRLATSSIGHIYLADLNGDGVPEFCTVVSWGSGIVRTQVQAYDYANNLKYVLGWDNSGRYYYSLRIEEDTLKVRENDLWGVTPVSEVTYYDLIIEDGWLRPSRPHNPLLIELLQRQRSVP